MILGYVIKDMYMYFDCCRIYEGRQPTVIVCDPEMLKQVTIKDFSNFTNHRVSMTLY